MHIAHALRLLAEDSLLAAMPAASSAKIKDVAAVRAIPRGAAVCRQGQPADKLIIPVDGALRLATKHEDGQTTSSTLAPRRALNLREVLAGGTWSYSAFAEAELHVLEVGAATFRDLLKETPSYARYLHRITHLRSLRDAAGVLRRAGLHPRSVQRLFGVLQEREVAAGTLVTDEDPPPWVIVDRGALTLLREDGGDLVPTGELNPGEYYGGGAALGRTRPIHMRADARASIFVVTAGQLSTLCEEDRDLARVLALEHGDVQRRIRRAFTESGEAFTEIMLAGEQAVVTSSVDPEVQPPRAPTRAATEVGGRGQLDALGRPWAVPELRARRLEGFRCTLLEDSGAAALASLLKHQARPATFASVRRALHRRTPPSMLDLAQVAERQGLMSHAAKLSDVRGLRQLRAPFLLLVANRWVLVHEVGRRVLRLFDPLTGLREVPLRELRSVWSGAVLTFQDVRPFLASVAPPDPDQAGAVREASAAPEKRARSRLPYLALFGDVRSALVAALVVSVAVLLLSVVAPRLNGLVVDQVLVYGDVGLLGVIALGLVLIHLSTFALSGFRDLCLAHLGGVMEHRLSALTLRHTLGVAIEAHGEDRVGSALSRLGELGRIRASLSMDVIQIVLQLAQAAVYLVLVLTYSWKLGAILCIAVPLGYAIIRFGGKRYRAHYLALFDASTKMQSQTTEQVEQVATIKALGGGAAAQRRWEEALVAKIGVERSILRVQVWTQIGLNLVQEAVRIFAVYVGVRMVLGGGLSAGALIAITQYVSGALGPLMGLAGKLDDLEQVAISLRKVEELFQHPLEDADAVGVHTETAFEGGIVARDLMFAYGPEAPPVLRGVSFEIKPGQTVAIVGRSGSGKTTLAKLLHGSVRPTSGELIFDDQDSRSLSLPAIRRNVGIVLQESQLFAGTILENIAYGDDRPDEHRVRECARLAAAHDFIMAFPNRYQTYLAEGGLGLSGGQRQRICIARALYRSPRILVMDEATSALDAESERAIMANMRDILRDRTGIVIAHRLNTVKHADRILVIDQGELVEDGTHDELVARRGLYHALFGQQFHQN